MSSPFATDEFRLQLAAWRNQTASPNAGAGTARNLGSVFERSGTFPTTPLETYFKLNSTDTGWVRENLVNLRVFNIVRDFGAVGDGATNNTTAIRNAIAAAKAAGGGNIYFPPAVLGYAVNKVLNEEAVFAVDNCQNITFFGDGYNSWIKFTGDAFAQTVELFRIFNLSQRIVFFGLRFNTTGLFNFIEQTHFIQLSQSNPPVVNTNSHDLLVYNCQFDPIRGDQIRLLGGNGAFGAGFVVYGARIFYNTFNSDDNTRTPISSQRDVSTIDVVNNWFTRGLQQQIDFEPAGGLGPARFNIVGNIMELNVASSNIAITLSGVDLTHPSQQHNCSFNIILTAGAIQAINCIRTTLVGNIIDMGEVLLGADATPITMRNPLDVVVDGNILIAENIIPGGFERPCLYFFVDNPGDISRLEISNNLCRGIATVNANILVRLEDCEQMVCSGNLVFFDVDTAAGTWDGIQMRAIQRTGQDWVCVGNMVIATRDRITDAIHVTTQDGLDIHNCVVNENYTRNSTQAVRFNAAGAGTFLDWRAVTGNNSRDDLTAFLTPPTPDNHGATINGSAGPAAQIAAINVAGNPNTRVTAPNGSLCTNSQGVAGAVIFTKDAGTGNTGWAIVGPSEFIFGALSSSAATAARFFAPGAGQLIESTTEIQMRMPRAGVIRNMRIQCTAGVGGGNNTYTLRINGVATALSILMSNIASSGGPDTSQVNVAAGDLISVQVTKTLAPATPQTNIVITVELTG